MRRVGRMGALMIAARDRAMMRLALASLAFPLIAGCISPKFRPVPAARVYTPGVEITAVDGSFKLVGSQPVQVPFHADCNARGEFGHSLWNRGGEDILPTHRDAIAKGARRVMVKVPGIDEPLHGILAFCMVPAKSTGDGTSVHSIVIPAADAQTAASGKLTVLYSHVIWKVYSSVLAPTAWVLWLSDKEIQ